MCWGAPVLGPGLTSQVPTSSLGTPKMLRGGSGCAPGKRPCSPPPVAFVSGPPGSCLGVRPPTGCSLGPRQVPIRVYRRLINNSGWQSSREKASPPPPPALAAGAGRHKSQAASGCRSRSRPAAVHENRPALPGGLGTTLREPGAPRPPQPLPRRCPRRGWQASPPHASLRSAGRNAPARLRQPPVTWKESQEVARRWPGGPASPSRGHPQSSCAGGGQAPLLAACSVTGSNSRRDWQGPDPSFPARADGAVSWAVSWPGPSAALATFSSAVSPPGPPLGT